MNWREDVIGFDCEGEQLVGVVTRPDEPHDAGVVIVVGGPQYRAGSHRQFVALARCLADAGFAVLRFDVRGMGDSSGALRNFEQVGADIRAAIDALLVTVPSVQRVALWGLCDGASAALLYLHEQRDARVAGLCLANPWVRSEASLAKTHVKHYYRQRLSERAFWIKLASGKVALGALAGLWRSLRSALAPATAPPAGGAAYQQRMAQAWAAFNGPLLLLMSERDYTANEFDEFTATAPDWRRAMQTRGPERVTLSDADHTCSTPAAQRAAEAATAAWARRAFASSS
jgi:uncharacterized protein